MLSRWVWFPALLLVVGCNGGALTLDAASGQAGAGGTGGGQAGADGGTDAVAAVGCGKDLSGTWDLIAQKPGSTSDTAVMVIGPEIFSITVANPTSTPGRLEYTASGTPKATFQNRTLRAISIQHTPAALETGSVPLALGGAWKFTGESGFCMASVGVGLASGRCTSVQLDTNVGAGEWPNKLPALLYDRTYAATRTEALPSRFGDLGGVWRASPEGASEGCTIRVEGNKLSADCTANIFAGKTELTIGDDCVASGVNNGGYEISGRKR